MEYKKFGDTYVVRIMRGEEVMSELTELFNKENIRLATIEGIAAAGKIVMGCYDFDTKFYKKSVFEGQTFEVSSFLGSVTEFEGKPYLHVHVCFAGEDGIAHAGHLNEAVIAVTCELFVKCIDGEVKRAFDEETGLNLFSLK
ncbi:MAG: DNA-binding protein [Firmicutes bacterium]|nr:DNA-binding protein [Bacillota bacterium]